MTTKQSKTFGFILYISILVVAGCTSSDKNHEYGLNLERASYIPARISILPCTTWMADPYPEQPETNIDDITLTELCAEFDKFVIGGFNGQPLMKGLSPSLVKKLLERSDDKKALSEIPDIWKKHKPEGCENCSSPILYYRNVLEKNLYWRAWINQFSRTVRNSDASLIPIIFYVREDKLKDRGLLISKRHAGIVLLLIDNSNTELLWSGGRRAEVSNSELPILDDDFKEYPEWPLLYDRLFQKDIWIDFPGRQTY